MVTLTKSDLGAYFSIVSDQPVLMIVDRSIDDDEEGVEVAIEDLFLFPEEDADLIAKLKDLLAEMRSR